MGISARICFTILLAASASFFGLYPAAAVQGAWTGQKFRAPFGSIQEFAQIAMVFFRQQPVPGGGAADQRLAVHPRVLI